MSDSNYTYLEAAARRKKKNQVISILIIIAVVLVGVAIWGVREHQKNEAAERIKNALNSQAEAPTFAADTVPAAEQAIVTPSGPETPVEVKPPEERVAPLKPVKLKPTAPLDAEAKTRAEAERQAQAEATQLAREEAAAKAKAEAEAKAQAKAQAEAEKKAQAEAARLAKGEAAAKAKAEAEAKAQAKAQAEAEKKAQAEAARLAKGEVAAKAKAEAEAKAEAKAKAEAEAKAQAEADKKAKVEAARLAKGEVAAKAKAEAEAKAQAKAQAEAEKKAQAEAARLAKEDPVKAKGKVEATKTPPGPTKTFAPEDLPLPAKAEVTEETRVAINTMPKAADVAAAAPAEAATASDIFRQGTAAFKQNDFANANRLFSQLSKPATKKRGDPVRDEYVQGNFMRGVALLRTSHTSEAVTAFLAVLEYEKYYPLANLNLGICYVDLKQYAKAHKAFEAVVRDQNAIDPAMFDDVMQRTKYFWALAWTRMYKISKDPDKQAYYRQQSILRWKDYEIWFGKNTRYRAENQKADDYLKSLSSL